MLDGLRQRLQLLQKATGIDGVAGVLPLGLPAVDGILGGGLLHGALHEIAAVSEAHLAAATAFTLGLSSLGCMSISSSPLPWGEVDARKAPGEGLRPIESHLPPHPNPLLPGERESHRHRGATEKKTRGSLVWIAEDMALAESGAPYAPGLDAFGLMPERLLTVSVAHRRDLMGAMEEALRCRAVGAVIGEVRHGTLDPVAVRRLSLAATSHGGLAFLLRARPQRDASTAATRWIVGAAAPSHRQLEFGPSRFAAQLVRNRRGPTASWIFEWSDDDECFARSTPALPVAAAAFDRPRRKVA